MPTVVSPHVKRKLTSLMKRGRITIAEAAAFAGVSYQAADKWCRRKGFDPRAKRALWARKDIEREIGLIRQPSKRELREQVADAEQMWRFKHGEGDGLESRQETEIH